ncbi:MULTISPECIES: cell division protein FtsL [Microbulbifer]|uniref:Cell division protein FtsL n=1 Tax=Microbulbifer celer TaxID=435905 RepID=A0ABW3U3B8_9GAMM|nr:MULTISPECIES: cell division protein FtsL [Microbulbifer]UFN58001.1 cell division protein FtsL [Microbulbifer celer]
MAGAQGGKQRDTPGSKWLLGSVWLLLMISALGVVYTTQESRELTAKLEQAQRHRDELRYEQERLLLERGAWSAYSRIEEVAQKELKMHAPTQDERVLVPARR